MFVSDPKKPVGGHVMVSLHSNVFFIIPFKAQFPHCLLRGSIFIRCLYNRILTRTRLHNGKRRISIVESSTPWIPVDDTLRSVAVDA